MGYDRLAELVVDYCASRNLDLEYYVQGLLKGGPLTEPMVATLIRYHVDWLKIEV